MSNPAAKPPTPRGHVVAAIVCGILAFVLFQFFGNATRGYIASSSLFYWWGFQWLNPGSETEHGWLILGLSMWLWRRNLSIADRGLRNADWTGPVSGNRTLETGDRRPETGNRGPEADESMPEMEADGRTRAGRVQRELGRASGLEIGNPQSAIRNPQANRPYPDRRLALSTPVAAILAGLALHALGFAAQQTRISIVAFLIFAWGVVRLGGGRRWGDAAMFPLAFMLFAIPISALDEIGLPMRLWVTSAGERIAHLAGIDVVRSGTQLIAPDGRFNYDVAAPCSGVRSLMALTALSVLIGYLNFHSWWRRVLVLGLSFPLVYLGNVARIVAIIIAAQAGGSEWGDRAHEVMGYGVFVIVLGGVLLAVKLIHRWRPETNRHADHLNRDFPPDVRVTNPPAWLRETNQEASAGAETSASGIHAHTSADRTAPGRSAPREQPRATSARQMLTCHPLDDKSRCHLMDDKQRGAVWGVVAGVVAIVAGEMFFLHRLAQMPQRGEVGVVLAEDGLNPVELPAFLGTEWIGQRAQVSAVEREILPPDTGFSRKNYAFLADRTRDVFLSIVLSGRDRTSIHRPELCLIGQGWTIHDAAQQTFRLPAERGKAVGEFRATVLRVRREIPSAQGKVVVPQLVAYWFVAGDTIVPSHWKRFAHDAWNRVARARADRWAYVLMQTDARDGEAAALARMQTVLDGTLPAFQRALP